MNLHLDLWAWTALYAVAGVVLTAAVVADNRDELADLYDAIASHRSRFRARLWLAAGALWSVVSWPRIAASYRRAWQETVAGRHRRHEQEADVVALPGVDYSIARWQDAA